MNSTSQAKELQDCNHEPRSGTHSAAFSKEFAATSVDQRFILQLQQLEHVPNFSVPPAASAKFVPNTVSASPGNGCTGKMELIVGPEQNKGNTTQRMSKH